MKKLSDEELNNKVGSCNDADILFEIQTEIGWRLKGYHSDYKSNVQSIKFLSNTLDVCKNRIRIITERDVVLAKENTRVNHNFRVNAKRILSKETYNKILSVSQLTIKEARKLMKIEELISIE